MFVATAQFAQNAAGNARANAAAAQGGQQRQQNGNQQQTSDG